MNRISKGLISIAITGLGLAPVASYATNGLFLEGTGNKSRAMGGVGIATPLDSLSAMSNPATISGMKNRLDIGMDIFYADVESQLGSVSATSEAAINGLDLNKTFFMPAMAITYQWNEKITLGFAMAAAGGGGTKFTTNFYEAARNKNPNAPSVNTNLGVDLAIMEMATTIAYKANDVHSFGASFLIGVARFEAQGLELFSTFTPSNTPDNLTNQGKDWSLGAGARVGWMGDYGKYKVGAAYTSKIWMQNFDKYRELFAEGGSLDVPASFGLGASMQVMPDLLLAVDVKKTFYEDVKAIGNRGPNIPPGAPLDSPDQELGRSNGFGFGWEDQVVLKLGAAYTLSETLILRGGYNYGASPIDEKTEIIFNLLAPATTEHHMTLGATYVLNPTMEINVSYIHAFENQQSGPTYISDDGSNLGRLKMSQDALGGSFSWQY